MTNKARSALHLINSGLTCQVTRQMIDRLDRAGLIDYSNSQGWHLTPTGHDALSIYPR